VRRQFSDGHFARTAFVLAAVLYSVYGISRVNTYLTSGYDLGIFDQAVRHYAHFQAPIVTLKGDGYTIWADHFHPIIALWAPLYWIWDNIRVLVIGQAVVVASAAFPLWRFLRRHVTRTPWAKLFLAGALLGWPIQCLIDFDVHEIAFAIPLLAWIIDALDRRDDATLLVCSALLLFVREDMGVIVALTGLLRFFRCHPAKGRISATRKWLIALALILAGITTFILTTTVIIPHFSGGGGITIGITPTLGTLRVTPSSPS